MVLRVDNVDRWFGTTHACEQVSFEVQPGEVVALLGENGAGKSTMLSIIAGFVIPDAGAVEVAGMPLRFGDPAQVLRRGVGTAFQHFSLAPSLTVRESFALAGLDAGAATRALPPHVPADARIGDLTVPARQQVEFLKARLTASNVLLLDEPTSLLGNQDVGRVLEQIRDVAAAGSGCVFVTHRLREALAVADRIVVMRRGRVVTELTRPDDGDWSADAAPSLLTAMFGGEETVDAEQAARPYARDAAGSEVVRIAGLCGSDAMTLDLPRGRIVAVAGIAGNGQQSLVGLLAGETARQVQLMPVRGQSGMLTGSAMHAWFHDHVVVVPEDRLHEGGAVSMPLGENLVLRDLVAGRIGNHGLVSTSTVRNRADAMIARWHIRPPDPTAPFGTLSGGNMQRVLLARALDPLPAVLVAVRPTHGLDHHSVAMVRRQLRAAANAGVAVVTIEQELDDALRHADQVGVMYRNGVSDIVAAADADRRALERLMVEGWRA